MPLDNFVLAILNYTETEILPALSAAPWFRWLGGGLLAVIAPNVKQFFLNHSARMQMLGIMDAAGNVSKDALTKFFDGAFKQQESITIAPAQMLFGANNALANSIPPFDITLNRADAERFLSML